jgi:hypothetical protein
VPAAQIPIRPLKDSSDTMGSVAASLTSLEELEPGGTEPTSRADITLSRSASGEGWHDAAFVFCVVLAYASFLAAGMARHELWRDEAQAWLIVRDAGSLRELLHLLSYEGHPALWYLLLRPLTYVTHSPTAMQALHGVIAAAAVCVFVRFSPFTRAQKVLWCFGYYSLFEYGIISRNYSLGVLLLWTLCALWPRRRQAVIATAIVLALLINANVFAALIAAGFAAVWLGDTWWRRRDSAAADASMRTWPRPAFALLILIAASAFCLWTVYPAEDSLIRPAVTGGHEAGETRAFLEHAAHCFADIWKSNVPIPDPATRSFWNSNVIRSDTRMGLVTAVVLSGAMLIAAIWTLRRSRVAVAMYLVATTLLVTGTTVLLPDAMRHVGHLSLAFIACAWVERLERPLDSIGGRPNASLLTALLAAQFLAGMYATTVDLRRSFSSGDEAAHWLRENRLADAALVGDVAHRYSPLVARLDTRIYYPVRRSWGSYALLDQAKKDATPEEVEGACRALLTEGRPVILITTRPLADPPGDLRYEPLAAFTGSVTRESYHLYRVWSGPDR